MKIDPNDPRLTAYALGELSEHDRAAFRVLLNADPEARQEVERIQRAATALSKRFAAEPCPGLEPEQRLAVHERLIPQEKTARGKFHWWIGFLAGAAALGLIALLLWPQFITGRILAHNAYKLSQNSASVARNTPLPPTRLAPAVNGQTLTGENLDQIGPWDGANNSLPMGFNGGTASLMIANGGVLTNSGAITVGGNGGDQFEKSVSVDGVIVGDKGIDLKTSARSHREPGWPNDLAASLVAFSNTVTMAGSQLQPNYYVGGNMMAAGSASGDRIVKSTVLTNNSSVVSGSMAIGEGGFNFGETGVGSSNNTTTVLGSTVWNNGNLALVNGQTTANGALVVHSGPINLADQGSTPHAAFNGLLVTNATLLTIGGANNSVTVLGNAAWNLNGAPLLIVSNGAYNTYYVNQTGRTLLPNEPVAAPGTENYTPIEENPFHAVTREPLSTFGLDVNTASYANLRRFLTQGQLPPRDAVRIEEMLNYFPYDYPAPPNNDPFALYVEMGECPWNSAHQLVLVGLKAKDIKPRKQPPLNLVFLLDISGSMADENKLPLIKQALHLLVNQLGARDRVSIVVYANNSKVLLHSTHGDDHETILAAIDSLSADGTTNGGEGIQSAYREARENFMEGGVNRVILCTDGDFNVGITDQTQLGNMIENLANTGVFLNVFGFGMGNVKDSTMEMLANRGRGQYAYIGDLEEARKNLVHQGRSTFVTVAKDSKIQIEFNPAHVAAYRLIGYESRVMPAQAFNDDHKTAGAGSVGAAHTVTALYEIIPAGAGNPPGVDPLKYQAQPRPQPQPRLNQAFADEWMTIKLRYKDPEGDSSKLLTAAIKDSHLRWRGASDDFRFAAAVADFGLVLRDSPQKGDASLDLAIDLANDARHHDPDGYRAEFIELVKRAQALGQR